MVGLCDINQKYVVPLCFQGNEVNNLELEKDEEESCTVGLNPRCIWVEVGKVQFIY